MVQGFIQGILARVVMLFAVLSFFSFVLSGLNWFWGLLTLALIVWSSWLKYLSQHTVRVRD